MSKRLTDREQLLHKFQQMTDSEVEDILDYVLLKEQTVQRHAKRERTRKDMHASSLRPSEDELLVLLSSAYENRRALQVFEWETARRRSEMKIGGAARG